MAFLEEPKRKSRRGHGVTTEIYSLSLNKRLAKDMEEFLEIEGISRSYFIQECIRKGLERFRESGFVYLIKWGEKDFEGNTTVKIGRTKNPSERLNQLAGGNGTMLPVTLEMLHLIECENAKKVEGMLHKHFGKKRIESTEYFKVDDNDLAWFRGEGYRDIRGISQFLD